MQKWEVRRLQERSHAIDIDWRKRMGWEFWVLLTTDRHWDNPKSNRDLQKKHLDQALERNAPVIDAGDLFCAMQGKNDKRGSKSDIRPEHQDGKYFDLLVDTAIDWFKPYKDIIAVQGFGNHESSIKNHHETDIHSRFCDGLGIEAGGYGGYVKFLFNSHSCRRSCNLKYFHGSGGGGPVTKGVIQAQRRAAIYPDADVVFTGHIHEQWAVDHVTERLTQNGTVHFKNQLHICGPTYKEEHGQDGWHDQRGAPPKPIGAWWLRFYNSSNSELRWQAIQAEGL